VCSFEVCIRPPQTVELARYVLCARQKRDSPVYLCCVSLSLALRLSFSLSMARSLALTKTRVAKLCSARILPLALPAAISVAHLARNNSIFPPGSNASRALCHALPRCSVTLLSTDVFANNQFYTHELFRCKTAERTGFSKLGLFYLPCTQLNASYMLQAEINLIVCGLLTTVKPFNTAMYETPAGIYNK
jgi:hypothetical protein